MCGCETLSFGTAVYTNDRCRIMRDSLLLARFALSSLPDGFHGSLVDICAGNGAVGLAMLDEGFGGSADFVEIDPDACALLRRGVDENGLDKRCAVFERDLREFKPETKYDIAVCNPPYFDPARGDVAAARSGTARSELLCTLEDVLHCAARSLKERSRLFLCYRPERLARLFAAAAGCGFAPKTAAFVRKSPESEPWLVLVELRLHGGEGLRILPDIIDR